MLSILYEDRDIIVVEKPPGLDSQSSRSFAPDMVSEIRCYLTQKLAIHRLSTGRTASEPPYVGVIHRLDKPVGGIMVYGKTRSRLRLSAPYCRRGK